MPFRVPFTTKPFRLKHRDEGLVGVELRTSVASDYVYWLNHWKPQLGAHPSASWSWDQEISGGENLGGAVCVTLRRGDHVEGMISLADGPESSRIVKDAKMVYVELLGTAPWNRPPPLGERMLEGVGTTLVGVAYDLSTALGYGGRVGLHSKPDAENFYRHKVKMREFPPEVLSDGTWVYFELEPGKFPPP